MSYDAWAQYMRRGDFEGAWQQSDHIRRTIARFNDPELPRDIQPIWNGTPIDRARVLIRCYHGLGDTLQFIRYAPLVRERAAEVLLWAQPRLLPLLTGMPGVDQVLPLHDGAVGLPYDVDVEIMELPYLFRTTLDSIPDNVPYLRAQSVPLSRARGPAIGVVWTSGEWAPHRSIPLKALDPILRLPFTWYALQGGSAIAEWPHEVGAVRGRQDIRELARVIRSLDLLITVDSMPAHLAGALGVPVWTLLSTDADWRWLSDRSDSPWYPTMRLFRQRQPREWNFVVERVAEALRQLSRIPR